MNAITPIAGIGHNNPPAEPIPLQTVLNVVLAPRALDAMLARALAPHVTVTDDLLDEYKRFVAKTEGGIITETEDADAVDFRKDLDDALDALDATRVAIKAPVLAADRAIQAAAKAISGPVVTARAEVHRRHEAFLLVKDAEIRRQAAEAAHAAEEAAWHLAQEAEATRDAATFVQADLARAEQRAAEDVVFAPVLETTRMKTPTGNTSGLRDNWIYEVSDISAVPPAYLQVNDAVVKAAIKSGTRAIPGLKIRNAPKAR